MLLFIENEVSTVSNSGEYTFSTQFILQNYRSILQYPPPLTINMAKIVYMPTNIKGT